MDSKAKGTKLWAMGLMVLCTGLTSVAQVFYKLGVGNLEFNIMSILTNYFILGGLGLYAIGSGMMILALRGGEVSVLYPIIATSYIWVTMLSVRFLGESINSFKIIGIVSLILGIILIGVGSNEKDTTKFVEAV